MESKIIAEIDQFYDEQLIPSAIPAIQNNAMDIDPFLSGKQQDTRYGANLIMRPGKAILDLVSSIQNSIQEIEPTQYYYEPDQLHITFFELASSLNAVELQNHLEDYHSFINEKVKNKFSQYTLVNSRIFYTKTSISLGFYPCQQLMDDRVQIASDVEENNIFHNYRYLPKGTHITFMRFTENLKNPQKLGEFLLSLAKKRFELEASFSELLFTHGLTWYGNPKDIVTEKPYPLKESK